MMRKKGIVANVISVVIIIGEKLIIDMKKKNNIMLYLELCMVLFAMIFIIIPDWNLNPTTKDYFALLTVGELGFDIYNRIKEK